MNYFVFLGLILFGYMNVWFFVSIILKRNDIADIAWGLGFVFISWLSFLISENSGIQTFFINLLITIWGLRLAFHIFKRNHGKPEDSRYANWRIEWGKSFVIRSYFQVYILQGVLLYLISSSVLVINKVGFSEFNILLILGLVIWLFGFSFEAISDFQLSKFIKNPENKGKLMTSGLWRFSRHPNYFGEVTQWWGLFLISVLLPGGIFTLISPLTITFLILFISGIPMLEKKYVGREDFELYKKTTSAFFPLPPKRI